MGEKTLKEKKIDRKKNLHPSVYKMEADCFPVSEGTENKPNFS